MADSSVFKFSPQSIFQQLNMFEMKLGLERMEQMVKQLSHPEIFPFLIHLAGTNGKGSTFIFLENLLLQSGYQVAGTISPHLVNFRERFRFQAQSISDGELDATLNEVLHLLQMETREKKTWPIQPTYFELAIAVFFFWAQKKNPDFVLLETGLGGRLDATNVCDSKAVGITSISFDHQEQLGKEIGQILNEKLGIIKPKSAIFMGMQSPEVLLEWEKIKKRYRNEIYEAGVDFYWEKQDGKRIFRFPKKLGASQTYAFERLGLLGEHQWDNALLALALYFFSLPSSAFLSFALCQKALLDVVWPGRLQKLNSPIFPAPTPPIFLDGAHNESGMAALFRYLQAEFFTPPLKKICVAITWMKDKEIDKFLPPPTPFLEYQPIIFENQRAISGQEIQKKLQAKEPMHPEQFIQALKNGSFAGYDGIIITGSLYWVGEFLKLTQSKIP